MIKQEFKNLKIGDIVVITAHGKNKGKTGIVSEIYRDTLFGTGIAYLKPFKCEFGSSNKNAWRNKKPGLYGFSYVSIDCLDRKKSDKIFCVDDMYGNNSASWPTNNFTEQDLKVIDRFLQELNEHASGMTIDGIAILDNEED